MCDPRLLPHLVDAAAQHNLLQDARRREAVSNRVVARLLRAHRGLNGRAQLGAARIGGNNNGHLWV